MPSKSSTSPRVRAARPAKRASRRTPRATVAPAEPTPPSAVILQGPQEWFAAWSQFAGELQRAGEQTLQGLRHDAEAPAVEPAGEQAPTQLAGAAAERATQWAQVSRQLTASLLDLQTAWFKQVEAMTAQWMRPWLTENGRITFASAQDLVEPPEPNGPMQALRTAQRLWAESGKAWLLAVSHDLQDDRPPVRR